jgi:hypothetical protein
LDAPELRKTYRPSSLRVELLPDFFNLKVAAGVINAADPAHEVCFVDSLPMLQFLESSRQTLVVGQTFPEVLIKQGSFNLEGLQVCFYPL